MTSNLIPQVGAPTETPADAPSAEAAEAAAAAAAPTPAELAAEALPVNAEKLAERQEEDPVRSIWSMVLRPKKEGSTIKAP